nr:SGNH/GDSL hydrolase family protein [Sphingomonas sp. EC-HK361]
MKMIAVPMGAMLLAASIGVNAQTRTDQQQPTDAAEIRLHQDWAWLGRYAAANAALPSATAPRTVFIGDSITQGWYDKVPAFFSNTRIDRGIGGQTTPQMLVRFRADVVNLRPAVVQIMGGTNDIAGNTGPMTAEQTKDNIMAMADIARANGIRVILASIPPADHFPWRPGLETASKIAAMNLWLKAYAARIGATYADYWTALHDGDALRATLTYDGVHPNEAGYAAMAPVAERAIRTALSKPAPGLGR